jgi:type I restriction enzyme S subunit
MKKDWPKVRLGEVLHFTPRPVTLEANRTYQEIGIRSHGRGVFHKPPVTDAEIGSKRVFRIEPGDFVLNIVFAWEGAVAVASAPEAGMIGSHRFPTFRPDLTRLDPRYLLYLFRTELGLDLLGRVSPGGAGRNRTLNRGALLAQEVSLPPFRDQQRVVARIDELAAGIHEAYALRQQAEQEVEKLLPHVTAALVDNAAWPTRPLGEVLAEPPRNGLAPRPEAESGGRPMLRINSVSSSATRFVDLSAVKNVHVSDEEARPFLLQHDDVFIVRYNGDIARVAKPAIYKRKREHHTVFPDKLMRLRPRPSTMLPDFLVFALSSRNVREQIERRGKTTAGNIGVSGRDANSFVVAVPPLHEQRRIVAELDVLQADVDALKRVRAEATAEFDALLPAVLDRAFKGDL